MLVPYGLSTTHSLKQCHVKMHELIIVVILVVLPILVRKHSEISLISVSNYMEIMHYNRIQYVNLIMSKSVVDSGLFKVKF